MRKMKCRFYSLYIFRRRRVHTYHRHTPFIVDSSYYIKHTHTPRVLFFTFIISYRAGNAVNDFSRA